MQPLALADPLDRDDVAIPCLPAKHQASAYKRPIHIDGAGSALALLTRILRAVKAKPLAENVEQALALPNPPSPTRSLGAERPKPLAENVEQALALPNVIGNDPPSVDGEGDFHFVVFRRYSSHAQAKVRRASTA